MSELQNFVTLADYCVLEATGPDARTFLQAQLTNDISLATAANSATYTGYCTANGRLLATALVWQDPKVEERYCLLLPTDLADALCKRLTMFVLRSKLTLLISDAQVYGAYGTQATDSSAANNGLYPVTYDEALQRTHIVAASAQEQRYWVISDHAIDNASATDSATQQWHAETLQQGIATIHAATQDMFIPQTLNLELIHAVSYTKGCFPGQEVVARSHYRGTIRRRAALFSVAAADLNSEVVALAADTYSLDSEDQPRGRVINVAQGGEHYYLLAEVQLAEVDSLRYTLGSSSGPVLTLEALPYDIHHQRQNVRPKL